MLKHNTIHTFIISMLLALCAATTAMAEAKVGAPAPDFTLTDSNGTQHSLSGFKGKTVVLEWINFDCPFVKKFYEPGKMQELQKKYTGKDVVWLSICSSAPEKQGHFAGEDLKARITKEKWAGTGYLIDEDGKVGQMFGAKTTPHMYIIKADGTLAYNGGIDDTKSTKSEDIEKAKPVFANALDAVLEGKDPAESVPAYGCSVKYASK